MLTCSLNQIELGQGLIQDNYCKMKIMKICDLTHSFRGFSNYYTMYNKVKIESKIYGNY